MNTRVKVGMTRPGMTRNSPQITVNINATSDPTSRRRSAGPIVGGAPPFLNSGAF